MANRYNLHRVINSHPFDSLPSTQNFTGLLLLSPVPWSLSLIATLIIVQQCSYSHHVAHVRSSQSAHPIMVSLYSLFRSSITLLLSADSFNWPFPFRFTSPIHSSTQLLKYSVNLSFNNLRTLGSQFR